MSGSKPGRGSGRSRLRRRRPPSIKATATTRQAAAHLGNMTVRIDGFTDVVARLAVSADETRRAFDEFTRRVSASVVMYGSGPMPWPRPVEGARVTTLAGRPIEPDVQERVEKVQQGVRRDNVRAIRVRSDHDDSSGANPTSRQDRK